MSLLKTKPRWCPTAIATNQGWVNPVSKELLVAIGNLKAMLDAEVATVAEAVTVQVEALKETKTKKPKKGQQIIAEVVDYPNVDVIGE